MHANHPTGFTFSVPDDWEVSIDPTPEIAVLAIAPPNDSGFRRNITVTVCPLGEDWVDTHRWQQASVTGLAEALTDFHLIDAIVDVDAFRQLCTYTTLDHALSLEQWAWQWDRADAVQAVTLSATMTALETAMWADESAAIRDTWQEIDRGQS